MWLQQILFILNWRALMCQAQCPPILDFFSQSSIYYHKPRKDLKICRECYILKLFPSKLTMIKMKKWDIFNNLQLLRTSKVYFIEVAQQKMNELLIQKASLSLFYVPRLIKGFAATYLAGLVVDVSCINYHTWQRDTWKFHVNLFHPCLILLTAFHTFLSTIKTTKMWKS